MLNLSSTVVAEEYFGNERQQMMLGSLVVTIIVERVNSRSGSYERGFKFSTTTYGILCRSNLDKAKYKTIEYSADHGKTWHPDVKSAKKVRGKTILKRSSNGEFAFDSIQKINREYHGPSYKWKP